MPRKSRFVGDDEEAKAQIVIRAKDVDRSAEEVSEDRFSTWCDKMERADEKA